MDSSLKLLQLLPARSAPLSQGTLRRIVLQLPAPASAAQPPADSPHSPVPWDGEAQRPSQPKSQGLDDAAEGEGGSGQQPEQQDRSPTVQQDAPSAAAAGQEGPGPGSMPALLPSQQQQAQQAQQGMPSAASMTALQGYLQQLQEGRAGQASAGGGPNASRGGPLASRRATPGAADAATPGGYLAAAAAAAGAEAPPLRAAAEATQRLLAMRRSLMTAPAMLRGTESGPQPQQVREQPGGSNFSPLLLPAAMLRCPGRV